MIVALNSSAVAEGSVTVQVGEGAQSSSASGSSHVVICAQTLNNILGLENDRGVTSLTLTPDSSTLTFAFGPALGNTTSELSDGAIAAELLSELGRWIFGVVVHRLSGAYNACPQVGDGQAEVYAVVSTSSCMR